MRSAEGAMAKVLVADDDFLISTSVAEQLSAAGHSVDIAADGVAAYKRFRARSFDLLITDFEMPFANGSSLIDMVRHGQHNADVPIIVMSGRVPREVALNAVQVQAFVAKPFTGEQMTGLVNRILQETAARLPIAH